MDEVKKERIKFNTEIIKILCLLFIATGGGAISLIIKGKPTATETVITAFGMIFSLSIVMFGLYLYKTTKDLIE